MARHTIAVYAGLVAVPRLGLQRFGAFVGIGFPVSNGGLLESAPDDAIRVPDRAYSGAPLLTPSFPSHW